MKLRKRAFWPTLALAASVASFTACQAPASGGVAAGAGAGSGANPGLAATGFNGPAAPAPRNYKVDALIYDGVATATGDDEAISQILDDHHMTYKTVTSDELNAMTLDDFAQYGMIIWPGGYAGNMSDSLTRRTRDNIQKAVKETGLSFVGICAGAFIAVSPDTSWGLSVITDPELPYFYLSEKGVEDSMVDTKLPDGSSHQLVWWGGPYLPDVPHGVVSRYTSNGEAAIIQAWSGKGKVILSGPHPEAPQSWRDKLGLTDSDGLDWALAGQLFEAALHQQQLPTFN